MAKSDAAVEKAPAKPVAGKKITLNFKHELEKDGTQKITSGRKHRYKEQVDPQAGLGVVIGTLYVAEHIVMQLGNPDNLVLTVANAD